MKKIFDYFDYQEFLREFYEYQKSLNSYFSYRSMGKRVSLDSGFLVKVLTGKQHISLNSIPDFISLCNLNHREAEYFKVLVLFGRAQSDSDTNLYFEKLLSLRGVKTNVVEEHSYAFYQKWYHTAIWSILGYYHFRGDYKELAAKLIPKISAKQAEESIILLKDLGFIEQEDDGTIRCTKGKLTTGENWQSEAISDYQKNAIELSKEALDSQRKELRDISTVSVALSHKDIEEIKERAREFRQSILQLKTGNKKVDVVYQINMQIFPLTVINKEK